MDATKPKFDKNSQERTGRRMKVLLVVILLLLATVAGLVAFLRKPNFQIREIHTVDTKSLDADGVSRIARKYITGNYVLVVPRSNSLLFSKLGMEKFLVKNIPSLESAKVTFSERNILQVAVIEKKPQYVWCGAECYFVDQNGLLYEVSPKFTAGVFVIFKNTSSTFASTEASFIQNPLGKRFAPIGEFRTIVETLNALESYPVHVLGVEYLANTTPLAGGELINVGDIAITVDQIKDKIVNANVKIIITKNETTDSVIESLDLLVNDKNFSQALAVNGGALNYIDLRFPGKIYYKFGTAVPVIPEPSPKKP